MLMLSMILRMSAIVLVYLAVTYILWKKLNDRAITPGIRIAVGVIYGVMAVLSTHFGVNYGSMMLNIRDLGPMIAGMFFDPAAGIIAGLIGGAERYIAGTYFGVASYTTVACSISTCLAGFVAAFVRIYILKNKKPSVVYAFFMGAVIEVFHMYVVFTTHRSDMQMAFMVVKTCSVPMIIFSGIGLALVSVMLRRSANEWMNPFIKAPSEEVSVTHRFQVWLFLVTIGVLVTNFGFNYSMQTDAAVQEARADLKSAMADISYAFSRVRAHGGDAKNFTFHVGTYGTFEIIDSDGNHLAGTQGDKYDSAETAMMVSTHEDGDFFDAELGGEKSLCVTDSAGDADIFAEIPYSEVYDSRDIQAYETLLADILVFTVIYVLISLLVQAVVVDNVDLVNRSLTKITEGDLDEKVKVYDSSEFASLSDDINQMVDSLKGYIEAAERRIEQELILARTIQASVLPKQFDFRHGGFEIFATMDPAKHVGGDFYDFFFVEKDRLALVIADVSGKGIPAALFMMRARTAIRGLAETGGTPEDIFRKVNNELCDGNEADMFVTVWMGIVDLERGVARCVNAGHEYPALMRKGGNYELIPDKHGLPFGAMEGMQYEEYELRLEPGDCLYVYTDGVPEAINSDEEQYGTDRMLDALNADPDLPMKELLPEIKADIDSFVGGADPFDDITMLGFRYKGKDNKESKENKQTGKD